MALTPSTIAWERPNLLKAIVLASRRGLDRRMLGRLFSRRLCGRLGNVMDVFRREIGCLLLRGNLSGRFRRRQVTGGLPSAAGVSRSGLPGGLPQDSIGGGGKGFGRN